MSETDHTAPAGRVLNRRGVLLGGAGAIAAAIVASGGPNPSTAAAAATPQPLSARSGASAASVRKAYDFLAGKLDQYGSGTTLRVPQSYTGGFFAPINFVSSFAYDDSLMILAWLASGTPADRRRATLLGDTLLYAQAHDPIGDGRTRASYQPNPFVTADGSPQIGSPAAYTGNQAWVGLAFARLFAVTGKGRFLEGALRLARWIQEKTFDGARAPFGYTGGRNGDDQPFMFKATEHNIDIGAFYAMLAQLTGDRVWRSRSRTAFSFVAAMQDSTSGHVWTGTNIDGVSTNDNPIPGDVQNWAYIATVDPRYSRAVTWVAENLAATDAGYYGSSFSNTDTSKVWFEGTAHLALALRLRRDSGDATLREFLLHNIQKAQGTAVNGDGKGIVAASSDGLDSGFGDLYYASLHTGATAWYLLAARGYNPFRL